MNRFGLYFESCIKIGDDIWFSATNYGGIYRYNIHNKTTERIMEFPDEDANQLSLYQKICLYQHFLIFVPFKAEKVCIYDMDKRLSKQIELPHLKKTVNDYADFCEGIVYRKTLYIIGSAYPGIIKINLDTYEMEITYKVTEKPDNFNGIYFGGMVAVYQNLLYIPCCYQNSVLIYDMDYDIVSQIKLGKDSNQYSRIVNDGQDFYLFTSNTHHIVYWNKNKDICREIELNFQKFFIGEIICLDEKYIWVISIRPGEIYRIDRFNDKIYSVDLKKEFNISYAVPYLDGIYILDAITCNWYYVDSHGVIIDLRIRIEEQKNIEEVWKLFDQTMICEYEDSNFTMQFLFFRLLYKENPVLKMDVVKQEVGKKIWRKLSLEV